MTQIHDNQHVDVFGLVGTAIDGKFRVDAYVAEGGFGVVYRGVHSRWTVQSPSSACSFRTTFGPKSSSDA
jgi:hypothetical protein